ncbi:hypothetical protein CWC16_12555 [Pseudoalteromonas sp. S3776]|nr:hypothetical protein CWC16_12555 [Pseudoalteromonas sp. S3776]
MMILKVIFSSQRFLVKTRRIYASIASLLQVNSTQLSLKIAVRDRFIIQSSGYSNTLIYWSRTWQNLRYILKTTHLKNQNR